MSSRTIDRAQPRPRAAGTRSRGGESRGADSADSLMKRLWAATAARDAAEGKVVRRLIEIGQVLHRLDALTDKTWKTAAKEAGYHERVARRYRAIATRWGRDDGPDEEVLAQLPYDLIKLETLARLRIPQLMQFLKAHRPKQMSREEISQAVNDLTGETPARRKRPVRFAKLLDRHRKSLEELIEQITQREDLSDGERASAWQQMQTVIKRLQEVLAPPSPRLARGGSPKKG